MNDKQNAEIKIDEELEPRELTSEEILSTAGGPQITNDLPT